MRPHPSYYARGRNHPGKLISAEELHLYSRAKSLLKKGKDSLGTRELVKKLNEEGFTIGRYKTRSIMKKLRLIVSQRVAYKVTTKC